MKDINPGIYSSETQNFITTKHKIYFTAYDGVNGTGLWKTTGIPQNTKLVKILTEFPSPYRISDFASDGHKLYFIDSNYI